MKACLQQDWLINGLINGCCIIDEINERINGWIK